MTLHDLKLELEQHSSVRVFCLLSIHRLKISRRCHVHQRDIPRRIQVYLPEANVPNIGANNNESSHIFASTRDIHDIFPELIGSKESAT